MTDWKAMSESFCNHVETFYALKAELDDPATDLSKWSKTQHQRIWTLPMKMQVEIRCYHRERLS